MSGDHVQEKKRVVAFVPIKLNSQRLPGKMLMKLGDKPLLRYVFDTLMELQVDGVLDSVYCYCSDRRVIEHLPVGVNFLERPEELDRDETKGMDIYSAFTRAISADVYVLCHATSPLIKAVSIKRGIEGVVTDDDGGCDSAFSCSRIQTFCWFGNKTLNYDLTNVVRTQDIKPVFYETSAFYIFKREVILTGRRVGDKPYLVETDRIESIDIDEQQDFDLAKAIVG